MNHEHKIADAIEMLFRLPPSKRIKRWMAEDAANGIKWDSQGGNDGR